MTDETKTRTMTFSINTPVRIYNEKRSLIGTMALNDTMPTGLKLVLEGLWGYDNGQVPDRHFTPDKNYEIITAEGETVLSALTRALLEYLEDESVSVYRNYFVESLQMEAPGKYIIDVGT
jgi:hypothetical protein